MQYRRRLRSRIIISFLLFGTLLTAAFAVAAILLRGYMEDQLIGQQLNLELGHYVEAFRRDPENTIVPFSRITGYVWSDRKFANVPFAWRGLSNGVHTIVDDRQSGGPQSYVLAVHKEADAWLFLQYDMSHEIKLRRWLIVGLIGVVLLFSGISALIAFWAADSVMRPVADLARRLGQSSRGQGLDPLASHFANDEVGQLAATLDDYAARLTQLVVRDREFNADVSHELRTPLAVIRGAVELLLAQSDLSDKVRQRLLRIDRAARQSNDLTDALLLLSRNERQGPALGKLTDVGTVVDQVVETQRAALGSKPVNVQVERLAKPQVEAPAAVLAVALGNLIGNAFKYTAEGEVTIRVHLDRVIVEDSGKGIDPNEAARLFDRGYRGSGVSGQGAGLGLAIVLRLCDLYGWKVTLGARENGGAVATLAFH
ncbi:MAG: sensor histidine kinase [Lysobacterales bacterium CG02_land_8_20_14_3_00_62_12]|nr:MAG: sensor histidine kinase [Xanthomonadales bacterium CG02_land_8_20_14_3_00_62_12]